jgi:WhiB family redox-sensing transcriptional regulator
MALTWNRTFDWDSDQWRNQASCRSTAQELFFPVGSTGEAIDQIVAAKVVCDSCPVRAQCLQFALETNQEAGIWGGTSEEERRRLRRVWLARRRAAADRVAGLR